MDVVEHNQKAWDHESSNDGPWSVPVDAETIAKARVGDWSVLLTPNKAVPSEWFPELSGLEVLGLASAGGQQVPVFAAAGARLTSFDNSEIQLSKDKLVADREGLAIQYEQGDMADLSRFEDESFDLIFHPVSNVFAQNILPVWAEAFRVLKRGGVLLSGMFNPVFFIFDRQKDEAEKVLEVKYALPYSDVSSLEPAILQQYIAEKETLDFGHTLDDQLGGQTNAGFYITGFYEDTWSDEATALNKFMPVFIATRAVKP